MPLVAVLLALVAVAFFVLPLVGLLQRAPWGEVWDDLSNPAARDAIRLSLECSLWSTGLSILFGVPLAYVLARSRFPGRSLVRALVVLPMVLPPVVGGIALLFAFQRNNGLDRWAGSTTRSGCSSRSARSGVILAETFVAMPFLVITVEAGLRSMDRRYEDAAASLGANRWTVFRRVTLPLDRACAVRRRRAGVGTGPRGVRRHHHLRGQHPGPHADHPARGLQPARDRPGHRDRAEPGAARGLDHRAGPRSATTGSAASVTLDADGAAPARIARSRRPRRRRPTARRSPCSGRTARGRSTLLRAVAGLAPLAGGRIVIDGSVVDDPAADRYVVPERRSVGVVFQNYLLFPHLSVLENVAFGLRSRGVSRGRGPATGARMARARRISPGTATPSRTRSPVGSSNAWRWPARW